MQATQLFMPCAHAAPTQASADAEAEAGGMQDALAAQLLSLEVTEQQLRHADLQAEESALTAMGEYQAEALQVLQLGALGHKIDQEAELLSALAEATADMPGGINGLAPQRAAAPTLVELGPEQPGSSGDGGQNSADTPGVQSLEVQPDPPAPSMQGSTTMSGLPVVPAPSATATAHAGHNSSAVPGSAALPDTVALGPPSGSTGGGRPDAQHGATGHASGSAPVRPAVEAAASQGLLARLLNQELAIQYWYTGSAVVEQSIMR